MAGRFRLYADANIHGPVIDGLLRRGRDLIRAVDAYPEGTADDIHFECVAAEGRVVVSNDVDMMNLAEKWFDEKRMNVGDFIEAFEELAAKDFALRRSRHGEIPPG